MNDDFISDLSSSSFDHGSSFSTGIDDSFGSIFDDSFSGFNGHPYDGLHTFDNSNGLGTGPANSAIFGTGMYAIHTNSMNKNSSNDDLFKYNATNNFYSYNDESNDYSTESDSDSLGNIMSTIKFVFFILVIAILAL